MEFKHFGEQVYGFVVPQLAGLQSDPDTTLSEGTCKLAPKISRHVRSFQLFIFQDNLHNSHKQVKTTKHDVFLERK